MLSGGAHRTADTNVLGTKLIRDLELLARCVHEKRQLERGKN